jgi:hypothetical protein
MQLAKFRQVSDPKKILARFRIRARLMPTEWQETNPSQVDITKDGSLYTRLVRDRKAWTVYAHLEKSRIVVDGLLEDGARSSSATQDAPTRFEGGEVAPPGPKPSSIKPILEADCVIDVEEVAVVSQVSGYEVVDFRGLLGPTGLRAGDLPSGWDVVNQMNPQPSVDGAYRVHCHVQGKGWTVYSHVEAGRLVIDHVQEDGKPHFSATKLSQGREDNR